MKLNAIFANSMVFQAGKPARVFGTGGGKLKLELDGEVIEKTINAPEWCVEFAPRTYGGPYEMKAFLDGHEKLITDIWFGDVYLLSGQSNMQFKLHESTFDLSKAQAHPNMRMFSLERWEGGERFTPEDGWTACTKENAKDWSCIGYLVGDELACADTERALGFINCYQGAAAIQTFLPERAFEDERFDISDSMRHDMQYPWNAVKSSLYDYMLKNVLPYSMNAVLWYQGESNTSDSESLVYIDMLESMINCWREDLKDEKLPFVIIQIADYKPPCSEAWKRVQQAQLDIQKRMTGVKTVICRDVCDPMNIHPADKSVLCHRIAEVLK